MEDFANLALLLGRSDKESSRGGAGGGGGGESDHAVAHRCRGWRLLVALIFLLLVLLALFSFDLRVEEVQLGEVELLVRVLLARQLPDQLCDVASLPLNLFLREPLAHAPYGEVVVGDGVPEEGLDVLEQVNPTV